MDDVNKAIRDSFLSESNAAYRMVTPAKALGILDEMVEDPWFMGTTDCSALSVLSMMIKVCKPQKILQLGTFIGFTSILFASILSTYTEEGKVYTVEINNECHKKARHYTEKAGLSQYINYVDGSSLDAQVVQLLSDAGPYDFIYIDSSHEYASTLKELKTYVEGSLFTTTRTLVAFHDAGLRMRGLDATKKGGVAQALLHWYKSFGIRGKFQLFILEPPFYPNPCGLALIRKK